ncbi:MAG: hypothetical protein P8P48_01200 [Saprospiraceae bacterium]|nr:hypothetical protein [Saprospiraceae bacterium]
MSKYSILLLLSIGMLLSVSCEKEPSTTAQKDQIIGTWTLSNALRNGNTTETLNNFKLEFDNDTLLFSNLSGTREKQLYSIDENFIKTKGARINPEYQIINLTDSTLTLKMLMNNLEFDFEFVR